MSGFKAQRILDFDIENRPGAYWYDGQCTSEITAIAWSFVGPNEAMHTDYLESAQMTERGFKAKMQSILLGFKHAYDRADIVTGHYIKKHDLPIINSAMIQWLGQQLGPKLVIDTKMDLVKWSGYAKTQENIGFLMEFLSPEHIEYLSNKEHMSQMEWRAANRLTVEGVQETVRRVAGDVHQHKAIRLELVRHKMLHSPKVWRP